MAEPIKVQVRGLAELQSAFRQIDNDLPKELTKAFRAIADAVVREAAGKVPTVTGRAAGSIKPRSRQKGASIAFGGTAAPYFPWLNFGGTTGRGHGKGKGAIHRPLVKPDRYIYATLEARKEQTIKDIDAALESVARGAGFTTRGGV